MDDQEPAADPCADAAADTGAPDADAGAPDADAGAPDADAGAADGDANTLDAIYHLVARERRRRVLVTLSEHGPLALPDLAEHVASRERDVPIPELSDDERRRVQISLRHVHLPKLADAGVVDVDRDRGIATLTGDAAAFERVLRLADGEGELSA